ncbi:hypothetical protein BDV26DRAFT_230066 [Aspergillus bertholletiae]|uniref:Uncharacterized protein n=1 Tax=Aspergillus bertholletiae TaxID=1226010 RepID=A0A5N7B3X9_9EURO|nr:hypothetical protein BDV26DRAFT_230066 [Aspergillus bertholletiae]
MTSADSYVTRDLRAKFWWSIAVLVLAWPARTIGHGFLLAELLVSKSKGMISIHRCPSDTLEGLEWLLYGMYRINLSATVDFFWI